VLSPGKSGLRVYQALGGQERQYSNFFLTFEYRVLPGCKPCQTAQRRDQGTLHAKLPASFVLPTPLYFATAG